MHCVISLALFAQPVSTLNTPPSLTESKPRDAVGYLYMLASAFGVIFLPTTAKLALESGSNLFTVAFMRAIIAIVILALAVLIMRQNFRLPRKLVASSLAVGLAGATFVYGMYGAILSINISLALLILFLFPMVVASWGHFTGGSKLKSMQWIWGSAAVAGLILIVGVKFGETSWLGIGFALLAMVSTVVITLVNVKIVDHTGSLVANLHMSLWGLLFFGAGLLVTRDFVLPQTTVGELGLLANGFFYCLSWVAFFAGARILGATRASMFTLIEPPMAAFIAWLIFAEVFTLWQWVGFCIVMFSIFMFERASRR